MSGYGSVPINESTMEAGLNFVKNSVPQLVEFSKENLKKLEKYAKDGHYSWRVLALFAGISILALGATSIIADFFSLSPFDTVLDIYLIAFGVACKRC